MSKHDLAAARFKTTALVDNTRCTEYPVPKAAEAYAASYMKARCQEGADAGDISSAIGDTFYKLRRELGHDAQFMGGVLNCGDVLWGQMNQPHRAPAACTGTGRRQLFRAVLFSTPCDDYKSFGSDMHHDQGFPSLTYTDANTPRSEVQTHFDYENQHTYDTSTETLEVFQSKQSTFGDAVQQFDPNSNATSAAAAKKKARVWASRPLRH